MSRAGARSTAWECWIWYSREDPDYANPRDRDRRASPEWGEVFRKLPAHRRGSSCPAATRGHNRGRGHLMGAARKGRRRISRSIIRKATMVGVATRVQCAMDGAILRTDGPARPGVASPGIVFGPQVAGQPLPGVAAKRISEALTHPALSRHHATSVNRAVRRSNEIHIMGYENQLVEGPVTGLGA